ncbi:hypothetical protein [Crossiella sp. NPDC003009]
MSEPPPFLPPYRAVLVADNRDYDGDGPTGQRLDESVPEVLRATFDRIGQPGLWRELAFQDSSAHGHTLGLDTRYLPLLVEPYLQALRRELAARSRHTRSYPLRLRVSLGVCPLPTAGAPARVEAHNLINAQSVRNLARRADPTPAFVAAILSERVFNDVVRAGYTRLSPAEFTRTEVRVKQYHGTGYLHLPREGE